MRNFRAADPWRAARGRDSSEPLVQAEPWKPRAVDILHQQNRFASMYRMLKLTCALALCRVSLSLTSESPQNGLHEFVAQSPTRERLLPYAPREFSARPMPTMTVRFVPARRFFSCRRRYHRRYPHAFLMYSAPTPLGRGTMSGLWHFDVHFGNVDRHMPNRLHRVRMNSTPFRGRFCDFRNRQLVPTSCWQHNGNDTVSSQLRPSTVRA